MKYMRKIAHIQTLASIEKGKVLRKSKVPNRNSKRNGEN